MYKRFGVSMLYLQARMANQAMASLEPSELKRIADAKYDGDESKLTDKDKADAKDAAALAKSIAKKQTRRIVCFFCAACGRTGLATIRCGLRSL
jgi:hypothetical protein